MFYLTMHSTHFYLWLSGIGHVLKRLSKRRNLQPHFIGYSFRVTAVDILYAPSQRQYCTYHDLCYTSCGSLTEKRNSSVGPAGGINPTTHHTTRGHVYTALCCHSFIGARCSTLERAFVHGAMDHQIDPSWWTH